MGKTPAIVLVFFYLKGNYGDCFDGENCWCEDGRFLDTIEG